MSRQRKLTQPMISQIEAKGYRIDLATNTIYEFSDGTYVAYGSLDFDTVDALIRAIPEPRSDVKKARELRSQGLTLKEIKSECDKLGIINKWGSPPTISTIYKWVRHTEIQSKPKSTESI